MVGVNAAWVDQGRLFVRWDGAEVLLVESPFGASVLHRLVHTEPRHCWKTQERGARFMRGGMPWGTNGRDVDKIPVAVSAVSRGLRGGELLYTLRADDVHGLFAWVAEDGTERRLLHGTRFRFQDVSADHDHGKVACTIQYGATSHLAVLDADGSALTEVTEGDSMDMAPTWVPGAPDDLVFQSAGVARDEEGMPVSLGPSAIMRLNLGNGHITSVLEDPRHDLLSPRVAKDGSLWFIRRPWLAPDEKPWPPWFEVLLGPWRLLVALQAYLASRTRRLGEAHPGLVPSTWHLVCRGGDGTERVVEKGVVCYDVTPDGSVLVSNGRAVYHRGADGTRRDLGTGERILHVASA